MLFGRLIFFTARYLKTLPLACALALTAGSVYAQTLPSNPITFADGHATLGGDVSASSAPDDPGFFNYTDYERSAPPSHPDRSLRLFRLALTGSLTLNPHVAFLGQLQTENLDTPRMYGLYARIRPWTDRRFDIQVGRVPPTFGVFARETYASGNILIGYPLAYQYFTSLRPDALPASANDLIRMRGRGWESSFPVGNLTPDHGVPLISAFRWDTGVQAHAATDLVEATASVTMGTPSTPLVVDNNGGKQVAGRFVLRPVAGLVLGTSAARGAFVSDSAARAVPGGADADASAQTTWGADGEYSQGHYLVRGEAVLSRWTLPVIAKPFIGTPLSALALSVEGRYRLRPGLYVAARADHLGFSEITGTAGPATWDAPLWRTEVGGGYSLQRNLILKLSYQYNTRDGGRTRTLGLPAAQVVYWF